MSHTIQGTIRQLHGSLANYIEATYHIASAAMIRQRQALMDRAGVIHQVPYIESTPRYVSGRKFAEIEGLPAAALEIYTALATKEGPLDALLYDPPYKHQSDAIAQNLVDGLNLVIMTGTGSGKTESFLLPVLGKLANEAKTNPKGFGQQNAVRALILYPMNALVNDQLGRMRGMFGDPRTVALFKTWAGRPARFARYTSRTPYPGVRTSDKDGRKLKPFDDFYVEIQRTAEGPDGEEKQQAKALLGELKARGKWPAKPDLPAWYGEKGALWQDKKTGAFQRAVTLPDDVELVTRHEAQATPPDLLVTNYSMLEYMLMRPIERSIFDQTKDWLDANKQENFLVVLDEAHLYRGASGAEVGLLLRRLRDRIGIPPERFQVICATASFKDAAYAPTFGAQLSGAEASTFRPIEGDYAWRPHAAAGTAADAALLAAIDLDGFYAASTEEARATVLKPLYDYRAITPTNVAEADLYEALREFPPLSLLVNMTMKSACKVAEVGSALFPDAGAAADHAATVLMSLGSIARPHDKAPGLLPCRVHTFFRGLPGLWVCMDAECPEVPEAERSGIAGKMFGQPRSRCECGARVHELYTCRFCGTAYARAYTDDVDSPSALWLEPGARVRMEAGETSPLLPLDLLLEDPAEGNPTEPATYDLETGRINPHDEGPRSRTVYLRHDRTTPPPDDDGDVDESFDARGKFIPCACCGKVARFGRTTVQDHQTKGDQPFQALVAKQIEIQPPNSNTASKFAPLRGRKVLVFSDSRQVAARLAPNLQMYSTRDSLRPLIAWGFRRLQTVPMVNPVVSLEDLYLAVLLGSKTLGVRLRPELKGHENFAAEDMVEEAVKSGGAEADTGLTYLMLKVRSEHPPQALLEDIVTTVQDPFLGFEALALASLCERAELTPKLVALPDIPGVAQTPEAKIALARTWLRFWRNNGFWLTRMPEKWWGGKKKDGVSVKAKKGQGKFDRALPIVIPDKTSRKLFNDKWTPALLELFTTVVDGGYQFRGGELSLQFEGLWSRCNVCKSVHRPIPGVAHCLDCGSANVHVLDPDQDTAFLARKGYYRRPVMETLGPQQRQPLALIAAEHTAQLNAPQNEDVFSKAEENELLFQDVAPVLGKKAVRASAIDVLSSTTTMEVGIDIGALSGVALRNMPPGRANYQQRAGRAGRRGNAVATVLAFGSADSHDEHYFTAPDAMIRGDVVDPKLTLDNKEIVTRHVRAFLLQNYVQARILVVDPEQRHDLFSVLGTVEGFRDGKSTLNIFDFKDWLAKNEETLKARVASWIPSELDPADRAALLDEMMADCASTIEQALNIEGGAPPQPKEASDEEDAPEEEQAEPDEEKPSTKPNSGQLLDRLLYRGVLPRYAFPTDVATFHVFDEGRSSRFRPVMRFAPSQGLPIALTQYAPGKQIWISGKCYASGALYSVISDDRFKAWTDKQLYCECNVCGFARTYQIGEIAKGDKTDCPACATHNSFGEARYWVRPPGFAHPVDAEEVTSPDDMPDTSYATRAKLIMKTPSDLASWMPVNERLRGLKLREHLLVSNTGPKRDGYSYCTKCGRIEATSEATPLLSAPHNKPYPDEKEPTCEGAGTSRHIVLGTDFITDVALFSLEVAAPISLRPGLYPTDVALRTLSEALAKAAAALLDIEPGELMAEYRPSLTPEGVIGLKAEIFLYDTLPGGAGFASQLVTRGEELFGRALEVMRECPEQCSASCYRCLRSFKNKFEHDLLDRHVGAELLTYLINGTLPAFDADRVKTSTDLLLKDLVRQAPFGFAFELAPQAVAIIAKNAAKHYTIALSGPLTPGHPADASLSPEGLVLENELTVRRNLPAATREIRYKLTHAQS